MFELVRAHAQYNNRLFKIGAPVYDALVFILKPIRARVVMLANLPTSARVFDAACGTGAQSIAFAKRGYSVVGVDLSPDMLSHAKRKQGNFDATFIYGDASHVSYPNGYFDLSTISFGLHDMPEEIGLAVLHEMRRVTKQDGKIIVVDYDTSFPKIWESKYFNHFIKVGIQHYLDAVGLRIERKEHRLCGNVQILICQNRN